MINNPNGIKNSYVKESLILAFAIIVAGVSLYISIESVFDYSRSFFTSISASLDCLFQDIENVVKGLKN